MPKISVIVPVYNVEQYLPKCLDSIINQTFKDIEIICVDDCSTDDSLNILKKFQNKDNRINILRHKINKGLSAARNTAIKTANGEFIYFIDSDDWIDLDYLETMFNTIRSVSSDVVVNAAILAEYPNSAEKYFKNRYDYLVKSSDFISTVDFFNPEICTIKSVWCCLYKKEIIDKHNLKFLEGYIHEDVYFQHEYMNYASKIYIINKSNYHYRQRANSIMHNKDQLTQNRIRIYDAVYDLYKKNGWFDKNIKIISFAILGENIRKNTYNKICDFAEKYKNYVSSNKNLFSEYELFLFNAFLEKLNYDEFVNKYTDNIQKYYFFKKLRSNVKRDIKNA